MADEEKDWRNECILQDRVNIQRKDERKRIISGMNHRKDLRMKVGKEDEENTPEHKTKQNIFNQWLIGRN